jgi:hypothetical protein
VTGQKFGDGTTARLYNLPSGAVTETGNYATSQPAGKMEWTLFRVGRLTDGPEKPVQATYLGSGQDSLSISRAGVAQWVLEEIAERRWVEKAQCICNC